MICDLFKNKGSPALISSYRDVLLMDDDGKGVQRLLRKKLFPLANLLCVDSQFGGGLNGGETAIAHLYLRLFVDSIIFSRKSGAIVFYDVCSAFATLLRRIIFDIDQGDEHWLKKLSLAGFTQDDIDHIYNFIKCSFFDNIDSGDFSSAGNNLVFNLAQEWYTNTWTSQEFLPNVTYTTAGSAAGTPLADLMYSLAMSRVSKTMRWSLRNEGLETCLHKPDTGAEFPLADVSFVDDMALPIVCTAAMLVDHIANVCGIVYLTFLMFGMELNFLPGKSAVVLCFQGQGKKQAALDLFKADNLIRIKKLPNNFRGISIKVVDTYKHLGTQISFKGMNFELAFRCGLMRAETCKLRSILRNSELNFYKKINLIQAYLLSKGTFQCSTWAALSKSFYRRFHGCVMGMYRDALGDYHTPCSINDMFSDDDIIYNNSLIYPYTMIRMSRILLFVRIIRKNPPFVLNFMKQPMFGAASWVACLQQDLTWLAVSEKFSACAGFSVPQWADFFASLPESVGAIRKFCMSPWANVSTHNNLNNVAGLSHSLGCTCCKYTCDSDQQLALHMFKHHGIKDNIRLYVSGTRCPICLIEFWQREVLLNHVRRGRTPCKRQVLLRGPVLTSAQADAVDLELRTFYQNQHRRGLRRHAVSAPCIRALGPKLAFRSGPARVQVQP